MLFIGIDVSKLSFHVGALCDNTYHNHEFSNNKQGFKALFKWLDKFKDTKLFCLESTGIYSLALTEYIALSNKVVIANAKVVHDFAKMAMLKNKTDRVDAQLIAQYCQYLYLSGSYDQVLFKPAHDALKALRALVIRLEQLNQMLACEKNHLESAVDKTARKMIKASIKHLEKQMDRVRTAMDKLIKENENIAKQVEYLTSIDGIATKTACAILAYLGDITNFNNAKQVSLRRIKSQH